MKLSVRHLTRAHDLTKEDVELILATAQEMLPFARKEKTSDLMRGRVLATLFFEPSTRTRFSFETAMLRLGGSVISNYMMGETSSVKKRETLYDTAKMVSTFADVIAMRHPVEGSVSELATGSSVPVINAGDGPGDHPTQGLLDIFTIKNHFGRLGGLTYGMVGDMKFSRVLHAQCELLKHFGAEAKSRFILVSPAALRMPREIVEMLTAAGHSVQETENVSEVVGEFDVLSNTRIQEERFATPADFEKFRGVYSVTPELLTKAKKDMIVIDPLPRVDNQLAVAVDSDPRAKYFEQVQNGVAVRMALYKLLLG